MPRSQDGRWTKNCEVCGQEFQQRRPAQRTCSVACRAKLPHNTGGVRVKAGLQSRVCQNPGCGKQFEPVRENQIACSRACLLKCPSYVSAQHRTDRRPARRQRQNELRRQSPDKWAVTFRGNHGPNSMTPEVYLAKLEAQGGLCIICGRPPVGKGSSARLHADHDHATGQYRDLLCSTCNQGLGMFNDDPVLLRAAAEYIERHRTAAFLLEQAHRAR